MKKLVTILFCLSVFASSQAAGDKYLAGARSAGMANSSVGLRDVWSVYHNQAGLGYLDQYGLGIYYSDDFRLAELSMKTMALAAPFSFGTMAMSLSNYGYSKYSETRVGLAYGKKLGKRFAMGIQMNYLNINITDQYGNAGVVFAEIGILAEPVDNLFIGVHVYNPTRSKISDYNFETIPTIIRLGGAYNFSEKAIVSVEAVQEIGYKIVVKTGLEYNVVSNLFARAGISSDPESYYSFGLGYDLKNIKADFSFSQHPILGFTPHLSVSYSFSKKDKEKNDF